MGKRKAAEQPKAEPEVQVEPTVRIIGGEELPEDVIAEIVRIATLKGVSEVRVAAVSSTACVVWVGGTPVKVQFKR
jgi:hypothetical protein